MPTPFPQEFRDDVVRVALNRDAGVTLTQIAKDFGIHVGTLDKWLRQARTDAGEQSSVTPSEHEELKALRKRTRLLEQENEVLRRAAAYYRRRICREKALPARKTAGHRRDPCGGVVSGVEACSSTVLPLVAPARTRR